MKDSAGKIPVRIELATSEIESGPCQAWADPGQVMAAVAISLPSDSFGFYVEPRLDELSDLPTEGSSAELPVRVRDLVDRLQQVHARLFRDNRAGLEAAARSVRLTCAVGEEDRVYFVKASSIWLGLLRDGVTHRVEDISEAQSEHTGLGGAEKLRLDVTSLPVLPGDIVVMLAAEEDSGPDLRAVASVFGQTHDLKRACDGLVNLLGLQSEGAAAVAFRFVPIASTVSLTEENPIASLTAEFDGNAVAPPPVGTEAPPTRTEAASARIEVPPSDTPSVPDGPSPRGSEAESFLDSLGVSNVVSANFARDVGSGIQKGTEPREMPIDSHDTTVPPSAVGATEPDTAKETVSDSVASQPARSDPVASQSATPAEATTGAVRSVGGAHDGGTGTHDTRTTTAVTPEPQTTGPDKCKHVIAAGSSPDRDYHRGRNMLWPVLIAVVIGLGFGLAAFPGGGLKNLLPSESPLPGPTGELVVEPDPPAKAVFIDGEPVAEGTPAHFPNLSAGLHTVRFDLGVCGMWEAEVEVPEGDSFHFAPQITGSVNVTAADPSRAGKVWVEGRDPEALPTLLDGLPVGWHRIFYEDAKLPIWDQQVLVRSDKAATLVIPNNLRKGEGLLRIESLTYREGRGLMASPQDSVFVDDRWVGLTPLESPVEPGLHSVRIRSRAGESYTEMLEVHSAGTRYVVAQFGMSPRPSLKHRAPGRVELQGSLVLTMEVGTKSGEAISQPKLHFPGLDSRSREVQLSQVDPKKPVYVGILDPQKLPVSRDIRYYFTVQSATGETVFSDLYTLVVGRKGSAKRARRPATPPPPAPEPQNLAVAPKEKVPAPPVTASGPPEHKSSPTMEATSLPTSVEAAAAPRPAAGVEAAGASRSATGVKPAVTSRPLSTSEAAVPTHPPDETKTPAVQGAEPPPVAPSGDEGGSSTAEAAPEASPAEVEGEPSTDPEMTNPDEQTPPQTGLEYRLVRPTAPKRELTIRR